MVRAFAHGASSPCGGSGFHPSKYEWYFTLCMTPYNHNKNVLSASLNKTFPSLVALVVIVVVVVVVVYVVVIVVIIVVVEVIEVIKLRCIK